jgi:hypothetical protein
MAIIQMLVHVLLLAGLLSMTGASQATDPSCKEEDSESSGLLQVSQHGKSTATVGCASGECCAEVGEDPHDPKLDADGKCCDGLHKVKDKWWGSETCNFHCMVCSKAGEDVYRFCGGGCGGCHSGGDGLVPCCAGFIQKLVNGKHICVEEAAPEVDVKNEEVAVGRGATLHISGGDQNRTINGEVFDQAVTFGGDDEAAPEVDVKNEEVTAGKGATLHISGSDQNRTINDEVFDQPVTFGGD